MSFALELAKEKYATELKEADIKIDSRQHLVITKDSIMRVPFDATSSAIERGIKRLLEKVENDRKETIKRKQTTLFQEDK